MKKKLLLPLLFTLGLSLPHPFLFSQEEDNSARIILLPVHSLTDNEEYKNLEGLIYNVLLINLKKQEGLVIVDTENNYEQLRLHGNDYESILDTLSRSRSAGTCVTGEYYVKDRTLHVIITIVDLDYRRLKDCYIQTLPTGLDMLSQIEAMCTAIAVSIAEQLTSLGRDALFEKQVTSELRQQIDREERILEEILSRHHEIRFTPLTGLNIGKSVVSWSRNGPFISPALGIEYTWYWATTGT